MAQESSDFHNVCKTSDLPEGQGKTVQVHGKLIAVFRYEGDYYAIDDMCPHMGASLSGGHVTDGTVSCPWHAWRFRLSDGAWADAPRVKIGCYKTRVENDLIQVEVPNPPSVPGKQE